jgi:hypothetical protein
MLLFLCLALQDALVDRLAGDDLDDVKTAQSELVRKGKEAKPAVQKALAAAKKELKERYEAVLLRVEAGVDETAVKIGETPVDVDAEWFMEVAKEGTPAAAQGKKWAHLRATLRANNESDAEKVLVILSATLITLKERTKLIVEGPKKEPFQWTLLPRKLKSPAYDNLLDSKIPLGTRALVLFEIKIGDATAKLRTNVFELVEKK